jgi:hypothetical protein
MQQPRFTALPHQVRQQKTRYGICSLCFQDIVAGNGLVPNISPSFSLTVMFLPKITGTLEPNDQAAPRRSQNEPLVAARASSHVIRAAGILVALSKGEH